MSNVPPLVRRRPVVLRHAAALVLGITLVAGAGCGGDDGADAPSATSTTTTTAAPATTEARSDTTADDATGSEPDPVVAAELRDLACEFNALPTEPANAARALQLATTLVRRGATWLDGVDVDTSSWPAAADDFAAYTAPLTPEEQTRLDASVPEVSAFTLALSQVMARLDLSACPSA